MMNLFDALLAKLGLMRISQMPKTPSFEFDFQTRFIRIDFGNYPPSWSNSESARPMMFASY